LTEHHPQPEGELLLRTSPMPSETNAIGDIFGGWIMSQMDIAGAMMAIEIAGGRAVTIAVEAMRFIKPVRIGDIVCCYGKVMRIGTTSITIRVEVWLKPGFQEMTIEKNREFSLVTEASYTYVAVDHEGRKRRIPKTEVSAG
jgi:acyl-CoA thioesterase YciA